ncbi:MAG: hypothetical protein B7Z82_07355 [Halothiobacillus sp. 20-54-6]|nr:MAG: hypothetical protein B7Z82_07355 [Halothiobacillus sp. 20-54-6]
MEFLRIKTVREKLNGNLPFSLELMMKKYLLMMSLSAFTAPVWAAGQAVLQSSINGQTEQVQVSWLSDQQLRMDITRPPAEILLQNGALSAITQIGGMPIVANVADVDQMARALGQGGGLETVAGVPGEIYRMTWRDEQGKAHTDEAVLTKNATVVELSRALQNLGVAAHKGWDARSAEILHRGLGVLRYAKAYQLQSVSTQAPAASALALPDQSIDVQKLMQGLTGH